MEEAVPGRVRDRDREWPLSCSPRSSTRAQTTSGVPLSERPRGQRDFGLAELSVQEGFATVGSRGEESVRWVLPWYALLLVAVFAVAITGQGAYYLGVQAIVA